jgi:hypothetical protein
MLLNSRMVTESKITVPSNMTISGPNGPMHGLGTFPGLAPGAAGVGGGL